MHRPLDVDMRATHQHRPLEGGAGSGRVSTGGALCAFTYRHASKIFALLAVGLVIATVLTRHPSESASGKGGFAGLSGPLFGGGGSSTATVGGAYECIPNVDYQDFGSSFKGVSRRDCAALCNAMPNCRVWQHSTKAGGSCNTRYNNYTSFVSAYEGVESCLQTTHNPPDMTAYLGIAHWQGCYFKSAKPFLLDGADEVRRLGAKVLKVAFNFHEPWNDYPWHSPEWPTDTWRTWTPPPVDVAKHPYWKSLFEMDFDTYILIAYSNVARSSPDPEDWKSWLDPWYWVFQDPTSQQLRDETAQFYELTEHLLTTYPNKTFVLQMWEGDWTLRQDLPVDQRYNITAPVSRAKADRMVKWLAARQAGVTKARKAVGDKAGSTKVYHAAEVNLVRDSAQEYAKKGRVVVRQDMVTTVLPRVALDMISYSAYDSTLIPEASTGAFFEAVRFIQRMHRRTAEAPEKAVYVGEFGVNTMSTDWDDSMEKIKNAVNVGAAAGLAYLIYWQMFDNALNPKGKEHYGLDRCDSRMVAKGPVYDQQYLEGFFLQHPDMEYLRPPASYLEKMLHGKFDEVR